MNVGAQPHDPFNLYGKRSGYPSERKLRGPWNKYVSTDKALSGYNSNLG
jgi:hypothetical protein